MQSEESVSNGEKEADESTPKEEDDDHEEEEDWCVACSDDEKYESTKCKKGQLKWEPAPDDIMQLYEMVNQVGVIELEWQCPGRRAPSPVSTDYYEEEEDDEENRPEEKSDFDFMEEVSAPKLRRSGDAAPKGSAKKKTTSWDGILSNIRRHRKLEEMEKAQENAAAANKAQEEASSNS